MLNADKIKAQEDKNALAEGYAETIRLAKIALAKNKELLLHTTALNRAKIETKIAVWNAVIKENTEIYNHLINYYFTSSELTKSARDKPQFNYTISQIIDEYECGNFS